MFSKKKILVLAAFSLAFIIAIIIRNTEKYEANRVVAGHFYSELYQHCGAAYEGRIAANNHTYPFINDDQVIVAHIRICRRDRMKIALHVLSSNGKLWDRSRTLLITRSENDIFELRHLNRQMDGRLTGYSMYGGYSSGSGRNGIQQFIAYEENDIHDSWQIEIVPNQRFSYGSMKNGTWIFRVDFDLTAPLEELPPPPWGIDGNNREGMQEITLEDGRTILITCQI